MKNIILTAILLLFLNTSQAVQPVEGNWFNPDASGRGATIEIQNGIMIVTFFGYGSDRTNRWWQGVGFETFHGSGVYEGDLNSLEGGQCFGCSYEFPTVNSDNSLGQFSVSFNTWTSAVFSWSGGSETLLKIDVGYGGQKSYLYGVWSMLSFFSSGPTTGEEALTFYDEFEGSDGTQYVLGNRTGYIDNYLALASLAEDGSGTEALLILLDSSTSYYRLYLMQFNENKASGKCWLYRKDESPTGAGLDCAGAKLFDQYELNAPTSSNNKSFMKHETIDSMDFDNKSQKPAHELLINSAKAMATQLEALKK